MKFWLLTAVLLIAISSQLPLGASNAVAFESCRSRDIVASAAEPDFLFATEQEWKRFALEAELDRRR